MTHRELTEKIIGCAYRVHNRMGYGFPESVYEKCLALELRKAGLSAESQHPIRVSHHREVVGRFVADIVVEDTVIVELKSVRRLVVAHEIPRETRGQLSPRHPAKRGAGLVLNFGERKVEVKRKVKDLSLSGINRIPKIPFILLSRQKTYVTQFMNWGTSYLFA